MSSGDVPQITGSAYVSSSLGPIVGGMTMDSITGDPPWLASVQQFSDQFKEAEMSHKMRAPLRHTHRQLEQQPETMPTSNRRIVQVFIADPSENAPLEKSVLYQGEQKLTDLNDTELFFEVPINQILTSYNGERVKWLDKEASKKAGKDIFLDPVRIRDLKMVVVTIASF